jgi:hypothetical protein
MPTIAIIDGIVILMYWDDHAPPHFHVLKDAMRAKFEIATGAMLGGQLDRRSLRKVQQWTELNQDLLMTAWNTCQTGRTETTK